MKKLIYIVDDEENILEIISFNLEKNGYGVKSFINGKTFFEEFNFRKPDLVILDLMLPDMDGYEICKQIKKTETLPVMILSAKGEELDKVLGLELGADDYMVKPFGIRELMARVKNILKRTEMFQKDIDSRPLKEEYSFEEIILTLDEEKHEISLDEEVILLNPKEFQILSVLLKNINNLTTRADLIRIVWGDDYFGDTRTLDVHIRRIREKMSFKGFGQSYLRTVHGLGYKVVDSKKKI